MRAVLNPTLIAVIAAAVAAAGTAAYTFSSRRSLTQLLGLGSFSNFKKVHMAVVHR